MTVADELRQRLQDRLAMAREVLDREGYGDVAALVPIEEVLIWLDEIDPESRTIEALAESLPSPEQRQADTAVIEAAEAYSDRYDRPETAIRDWSRVKNELRAAVRARRALTEGGSK